LTYQSFASFNAPYHLLHLLYEKIIVSIQFLILCLMQRFTDMAFLWPIPIYQPFINRRLIFQKFLNLVFCFIIKNIMYSMPYLFFKNLKSRFMS